MPGVELKDKVFVSDGESSSGGSRCSSSGKTKKRRKKKSKKTTKTFERMQSSDSETESNRSKPRKKKKTKRKKKQSADDNYGLPERILTIPAKLNRNKRGTLKLYSASETIPNRACQAIRSHCSKKFKDAADLKHYPVVKLIVKELTKGGN